MRENVRLAALFALLCAGSTAVASVPADAVKCPLGQGEIMAALSSPKGSKKGQHNDLVGKVHVPELVERGTGFEGGQRFRVLASLGSAPWSYLSLYSLEQGGQVAHTGAKQRGTKQTDVKQTYAQETGVQEGGVPKGGVQKSGVQKSGARSVSDTRPDAAPAHYLAEGSAAWIFRRVTTDSDNAGRRIECATGQKLFVVIPRSGTPQIDVTAALSSVPGLTSAERYQFSKSAKGPPPGWQKMVVFRSSPGVIVPATLARLGSLVGCANGTCAESAGAVWALEPLGD